MNSSDNVKTIFVVIPATEKNGVAEVVTVPITSEVDLANFCRDHRGSLKDSTNIKATYQNLKVEGTYTFFGGFYKANENDTRRRQVDDKVLEFESAVAVKNMLGINASIHPNVMFKDAAGKTTMELDAVVVDAGAAYIVESAYSPQINEVNVLKDKVSKFKAMSKFHKHFRNVTKVVPVLAGRNWAIDTVKAATAAKQWRVLPSAAGYQVMRTLHTVAKRILK